MSDYIVTSDDGTTMIRISSKTPVNHLRYMIDNIERLRETVDYGMIKGKIRCGGCNEWVYPHEEHDSGSGFGYNCSPKKTAPDFQYWNMFDMNYICSTSKDMTPILKIVVPKKTDMNPTYVGHIWISDWDNFRTWLKNIIGEHHINVRGDVNRLTASEELELHRILNKMNDEN